MDEDEKQRQERIFVIARCLLQVGRAIDQQFFRAPFGVQNRTNKTNPAILIKGRQNLDKWQVSLMNSTSYSQVFLHYTILDDSIIWSRSSQNADCRICRRRVMPEKMILCDGCNRGRHLFCFKPKLTVSPNSTGYTHMITLCLFCFTCIYRKYQRVNGSAKTASPRRRRSPKRPSEHARYSRSI